MTDSRNEITLFTNMQIWYHKHIIHYMIFFILTGLPLVSPYFHWLAYAVGVPVAAFSGAADITSTGLQVCRIAHRVIAVLWIATSIPIIFAMLPKIHRWGITPRRREEQSWGGYISEGLADTKRVYIDWQYPEYMGKYNLLQIVAAWAVIFICLAMLASGLVLWLRLWFDGGLVSVMRVIHLAGFMAMIVFLMFHVYFAVHPVNRAGYEAMFRTGKDSVAHAKKKHPGLFI